MYAVKVLITRYLDDSFPGWVECKLIDVHKREITFVEKAPVVTTDDPVADSHYPQDGEIACQVIEKWHDDEGREVMTIDTNIPWGIESTTGETLFEVSSAQVMDINENTSGEREAK